MKKMILTAVAVLFASVAVSAQGSHAFEKGYRGNVSVGGNISVTKGWQSHSVELTTSHGYSFGDGMYVGGGIGVDVNFSGDYSGIPVFLDTKYNIVDWKLSPYVDCRMGMEAFVGEDGLAFIASPGIGLDYRRLSLRVGYRCEAGRAYGDSANTYVFFKINTISLSAAVNF